MVAMAVELTDEDLARRAQRGDRAAFDALVGRCQGRVYRLAYRFCGHAEDARELAQEVFVRAWLKLSAYDATRPWWPWLQQLATRVLLNAAERRPPLHRPLEAEDDRRPTLEPSAPAHEEPARRAVARAAQQAVAAALLELPAHWRAAMLLRHVEGLSYEEIAAALGQPLGTVKTHLFRARRWLLDRLGDWRPEELGGTP